MARYLLARRSTRRWLPLAAAVLVACSDATPAAAPAPSTSAPATSGVVAAGTPASPAATTVGAAAEQADRAFEASLRSRLRPPTMPSFALPLELFADAGDRSLAASLAVPPGLYDGIAVVDARCAADGATAADAGGVTRQLDGSGTYRADPVTIVVQGDGSGRYVDADTAITIQSDGSGRYRRGPLDVTVQGDGSGTYQDGTRTYRVSADGSGSYDDGVVRVEVDADGTGRYRDADRTIEVGPDGARTLAGDATPAAAVARVLRDRLPRFAPVPLLGRVPSPADGRSCGSVIRLDANVLFDFGEHAVRADASALLDRVATLLVALGSPALRVDGHTDGIGSEEYNLVLSQRRAEAVVAALVERGVAPGSMSPHGLGEQRPLRREVADDGTDDRWARQVNRRVELVLLDEGTRGQNDQGEPNP